MIYHSNSPKETRKIAANLAEVVDNRLRKSVIHRGVVIALEGELGAGKTTFVQAFAKALGIKSKIKSPTFNIIKKYKLKTERLKTKAKNKKSEALDFKPLALRFLYHIDCYRLKDHKEAIPLGIKDIFEEKNAIVLIEWPERISKILPKKITIIHIDHMDENRRKILIK